MFSVIGSTPLFQSASNTIPFMGMERYKSAFAAAVCGSASLERGWAFLVDVTFNAEEREKGEKHEMGH